MKKISVCMATYNGERFIEEQIKSILVQLSETDELIISDDSSTDDTIAKIESINDSRIKIFYSSSKGVIKNFENALKFASGDIIVLSDQDDVWLPNRLSIVEKKLQTNDLVIVNCQVVDQDLVPYDCIPPQPSLSFIQTLMKNGYLGCSMSFRASILPVILPFPKGIGMHDWWIALICLWKFNVHIENEKYFLYRRHGRNASCTGEKSNISIIKRVAIRLCLLYQLIMRIAFVSY